MLYYTEQTSLIVSFSINISAFKGNRSPRISVIDFKDTEVVNVGVFACSSYPRSLSFKVAEQKLPILHENCFQRSNIPRLLPSFLLRLFLTVHVFVFAMATEGIDPTPLAEPPYLHGLPSPYYTEAHRKFQQRCRTFCWENLISHAMDWEREGDVPEHVFKTFSKHGMLIPNLPSPLPVTWLKKLGIHDILGVKVEDWDYLYTGIYCDEVSRSRVI